MAGGIGNTGTSVVVMPTKVLVHKGKHGDRYFAINSERPDMAWIKLFKSIYKEQFCHDYTDDQIVKMFCGGEDEDVAQENIFATETHRFRMALQGNVHAMKWILDGRDNYEYEEWREEMLE